MRDLEPLKFFSHQRKLEVNMTHLKVSINTATIQSKNVM